VTSKTYDFERRLAEVAQEEEVKRKEKKDAKKRKRDEAREVDEARKRRAGMGLEDEAADKKTKGAFGNRKKEEEEEERIAKEQEQFQAMMGFAGGFGGGVKKR
jgi:hypothetical protein